MAVEVAAALAVQESWERLLLVAAVVAAVSATEPRVQAALVLLTGAVEAVLVALVRLAH